jgi:hypothetical protein
MNTPLPGTTQPLRISPGEAPPSPLSRLAAPAPTLAASTPSPRTTTHDLTDDQPCLDRPQGRALAVTARAHDDPAPNLPPTV